MTGVSDAAAKDDRTDDETACHLCARLARLMLSSGADAKVALRVVRTAAAAMKADVRVEIGNDAVFVSSGKAMRIGRALASSNVDMSRLAELDRLVDGLHRDSRCVETLEDRLEAAEAAKPIWSVPLTVLAVAITAASLSRLFGATWPIVLCAFVAGLVGTSLRVPLARRNANPVVLALAVAFVSSVVGALMARLFPGQSPVLALSAVGMVLTPGVPLLNGVRDLVEGHASISLARLMLGVSTVLAIAFGLFLGAGAVGDQLPVGDAPGRLPVWEDVIFGACAVLGYAMLLNVPRAALPLAILCGAVSHPLRTALEDAGFDLATGSLVGAIVAGLIAVAASRRFRVPPVTFAFPGTVAMLPGSYGFRAVIGGLQLMGRGSSAGITLIGETLGLTILTVVVTAAIAVGLSLAFVTGLLLRRWLRHRKQPTAA